MGKEIHTKKEELVGSRRERIIIRKIYKRLSACEICKLVDMVILQQMKIRKVNT
jgi:hypothetical protein